MNFEEYYNYFQSLVPSIIEFENPFPNKSFIEELRRTMGSYRDLKIVWLV